MASSWVAAPITGDADADAAAVVDALAAAGVRPDAVLSFWETSVPVATRAAAALGLPGNPVERRGCRAQQTAYPGSVRARRPAHAEVAAGPVARRALRGRCGDRVPGRDQAGVRGERRRVRPGRFARVSPEHLLGRSSGARDHARRRSPRGQRSRRGGVPGRRRVRRRPDPRRRRVRVLERLPELADRRAVVSGNRTSLPARSQRQGGPPPGGAQRADGSGVRVRARRAPRRGQVHGEGAAHRRGQRADGWWADPSDRRGGVGRGLDRGPPARCPRAAAAARAEPQAALCRRHIRSCTPRRQDVWQPCRSTT